MEEEEEEEEEEKINENKENSIDENNNNELKGIKKEKTSFRFLEDSATASTLTERM